MAFLKEHLNAFLNQPVEKKRSDHKLKNVDSVIDTRSWVLKEELKRQQFLNVVNQEGEELGDAEGWEDFSEPRTFLDQDVKQFEDKLKELSEEKDFLKNVIADKENEIESLLFRIQNMVEVDDSEESPGDASVLQKQLENMRKQYNDKENELKKTKEMLNNTEQMLKDLQMLIESTGDDPQKQKTQLDNIMKGLQVGMQDDIEHLQSRIKELEEQLKNANEENSQIKNELEAIGSGDENELNKMILGLRKELDKTKRSNAAENEALKNALKKKEEEISALKNMTDQPDKNKTPSSLLLRTDSKPDVESLKQKINEKDDEIKLLKDQLENEKKQNNNLKSDLNLLAGSDESGLKSKIIELTAELEELKSKPSARIIKPESVEKLTLESGNKGDLEDKIKELENLLLNERDENKKLHKDLANLKEKYDKLLSADDNELKKMLAEAEDKIEQLNKEKENFEKTLSPSPSQPPETGKPHSVPVTNNDTKGMSGDYEQLKKENNMLKDENHDLKNQIEELLRREIPENINNLLEDIENLKSKNKELKKENDKLNNVVGVDKSKADDSSLPGKDENIKTQTDMKKDDVINENNRLKNELEELKKQLPTTSKTDQQQLETKQVNPDETDLKTKLRKLEDENQQLKLTMKEEKEKCNETIAKKDKDIELLKGELDQTESGKDKVLKQKDDIKSDPDKKQIEDLTKKLNQLEVENGKLKADKDKCNDEMSNKMQDLQRLQDELKAVTGEKNKLEKEATDKVPSVNSENKILKDTNTQLEQDLEKMRKELDEYKNKGAAKPLDMPTKDTKPSEISPKDKKNIDTAPKDTKQPESTSEDTKTLEKASNQNLQEENLLLRAKVKDLEDKLKQTESKPVEEKPMLPKEKTDAKGSEIDGTLAQLKQENSKLKKDNEELKKEIADLKRRLAEAQSKNLGKENQDLFEPVNKGESASGTAEDMLNSYKQNIEGLKRENASLKDKVAKLEKQLKDPNNIIDDKVKPTSKEQLQLGDESKKEKSTTDRDKSPETKGPLTSNQEPTSKGDLKSTQPKSTTSKEKQPSPYTDEPSTSKKEVPLDQLDKTGKQHTVPQQDKKIIGKPSQGEIKSLSDEKGAPANVKSTPKPQDQTRKKRDISEEEKLASDEPVSSESKTSPQNQTRKKRDISETEKLTPDEPVSSESKTLPQNQTRKKRDISETEKLAPDEPVSSESKTSPQDQSLDKKEKNKIGKSATDVKPVPKSKETTSDSPETSKVKSPEKTTIKEEKPTIKEDKPSNVTEKPGDTDKKLKSKVPEQLTKDTREPKEDDKSAKAAKSKTQDKQPERTSKVPEKEEYGGGKAATSNLDPSQKKEEKKQTIGKTPQKVTTQQQEKPKSDIDESEGHTTAEKKPIKSREISPSQYGQKESKPGEVKSHEEAKAKPQDRQNLAEGGRLPQKQEVMDRKDKTNQDDDRSPKVAKSKPQEMPMAEKKLKQPEAPSHDEEKSVKTKRDMKKSPTAETGLKKSEAPKNDENLPKEKAAKQAIKRDAARLPLKENMDRQRQPEHGASVNEQLDHDTKPHSEEFSPSPISKSEGKVKQKPPKFDKKSAVGKPEKEDKTRDGAATKAPAKEKEISKTTKDKLAKLRETESGKDIPATDSKYTPGRKKDDLDYTPEKEKAKKRKREKGDMVLSDSITESYKDREIKSLPSDEMFGKSKESYKEDFGIGDSKEFYDEINELKKQLFEAEKLIESLKNENMHLKNKNDEMKRFRGSKEESQEGDGKYLSEDANKLNRILRKAIRHGLKTLYLDELEFVHNSLNNTLADRRGRPLTPGTKSPQELEKLLTRMEQKMASMMAWLEDYRQLSGEQLKKIMDYSNKVQRLSTALGLQSMTINSLTMENEHLRNVLESEKERVKNLQDMLRSVLDNCKCTRKYVLSQNYTGFKNA